jgi:membrane fusion protein, adhesin transport system
MKELIDNVSEFREKGVARWVLRVSVGGILALVTWAAFSRVDQVTRAQAQVIATDRNQVIQTADQGVLTGLHVQEGDLVKEGQLLVTLERERAQAAVDDSNAKVAALRITLARLQAEVFDRPLAFEKSLLTFTEYIRNQENLYRRRKTAIDEDVVALRSMMALSEQELKMNQTLEESGDVSRVEILRLQRAVADLKAQIVNKRNKYLQDAQAEMTKVQEDLNTQTELLRDRVQVLEHTQIVSPVKGIVKNIKFTTVGAVVRPADTVMEILPTEGTLIAEAKVSPSDIAFVSVGQSASVKLDAYDFSIFGAMHGEVIYVSADTLVEETRQGPTSYYRVRIRIKDAEFKGAKGANEIQIRPGMTATVDIKAQERTVLSYLTKPISKTLALSLGER